MQLPKHVGLIEIWETEMLKKIGHKTRLDQLDWVKRKGYKRTEEKLKQRSKVKAATLKRYTNRAKQYQPNSLLHNLISQGSIINLMENHFQKM